MKKIALELPGGNYIPEHLGFIGASEAIFFENTPAGIINALLPYIFIFAGIILFAMLIAGGFSIFVSAGNPEKIKKGQAMLVNALIGFLIIFSAYWIIQLVEYSLGIQVL